MGCLHPDSGIFAHGKPDLLYILSLIFFSILFMVLSLTVARKAVGALISEITKRTSDPSGYVLTVISMTGLAFGAITQRIGIQALFGFFLAGLIVGESKDLSEKVRSTIENFVYAVFVPIFFANIGLKIDIFRGFDFFLVSLFTAMGIIARFTGAWVGVLSAGIPGPRDGRFQSCTPLAEKCIIVIGALALELNLITEDIFVAIIAAAILSSVVLGPWLSFVLKKVAPKETVQIPSGATLNLSQ
jgi:Kef-type K+ transport system membrane component KefB